MDYLSYSLSHFIMNGVLAMIFKHVESMLRAFITVNGQTKLPFKEG